jgi:hypothetical protein
MLINMNYAKNGITRMADQVTVNIRSAVRTLTVEPGISRALSVIGGLFCILFFEIDLHHANGSFDSLAPLIKYRI